MDSTFTLNMSPVQTNSVPIQYTQPTSAPQIRSRITVVCAECKRLKLKCDRRTPCGSCTKRDTVQRCVYSPAAAEKIDLHSLNNRLLLVESQLNSLDLPSPAPSPSTSKHTDRALFATGPSGSSLAVTLKDVSSLYLEELGITIGDSTSASSDTWSPRRAPAAAVQVKVEDGADVTMNTQGECPSFPAASTLASNRKVTPQLLSYLPPLSALDPLENLLKLHPSGLNFRHFRERVATMKAWYSFEGGINATNLTVNTDVSVNTGESAARKNGFVKSLSPLSPVCCETGTKSDAGRKAGADASGSSSTSARRPTIEEPTMSLYAAAAAAFALAALVAQDSARVEREEGAEVNEDPGMQMDTDLFLAGLLKPCSPVPHRSCTSPWTGPLTPTQLHVLSTHALSAYEQALGGNKEMYDLDYILAGIFGLIWGLYGGEKSRGIGPRYVSGKVYGEVGKMVNVARLMGLSFDPDDAPGRWTLFQAEMRRRIWWEVVYYDLFVSDCMGQPPNIAEHSYTTRIPADVDEDTFKPRSMVLPLSGMQSPAVESDKQSQEDKWHENGFKYFELKCRLAQLVKSVKSRTFREGYTIELAARLEKEVSQWLQALPTPFRMRTDMSSEGPQISPILLAQRCSLAMTAHRIILKLYLPFIKETRGERAHQAFFATINAAHAIIHASRALYHAWAPRPFLLFEFYGFGRALFGAAVVCARAVAAQESAVWARTALEAAQGALEIMRDPAVEGPASEAVRVVEALCARAREPSVGMKRKIRDGETEGDAMFALPYVGPVVLACDVQPVSAVEKHPRTPVSPQQMSLESPLDGRSKAGADKHGKRTQYPAVGMRVRAHTQPSVRPVDASPMPTPAPLEQQNEMDERFHDLPTSHAYVASPQVQEQQEQQQQQQYTGITRTRRPSDLAQAAFHTGHTFVHPPPYTPTLPPSPYTPTSPYANAGTPYAGAYYAQGGSTGGYESARMACGAGGGMEGHTPMEAPCETRAYEADAGLVAGGYVDHQVGPGVDVQVQMQLPWSSENRQYWSEEYKFYAQ